MVCVEETNAAKAPKIWLGQVRFLQRNGEVSLLWYKAVSGNLYKLELDGEPWSKKPSSLTPVCVEAANLGCRLPGIHVTAPTVPLLSGSQPGLDVAMFK